LQAFTARRHEIDDGILGCLHAFGEGTLNGCRSIFSLFTVIAEGAQGTSFGILAGIKLLLFSIGDRAVISFLADRPSIEQAL
jgi:hypothetical protein